MDIILIDSNRSNHFIMKKLFKGLINIQGMKLIRRPTKDVQTILTSKPDLIFISIDQFGKSGLKFTKQLKKLLGYSTNIVFIADTDQYAVEAFELGVSDYLINPINKDRFIKMLYHL